MGGDQRWAPGQIRESFSRSARAYDKAAQSGENVAVPFGRYLLLERIKRGGMAEVYRAKVIGTDGFEKIVAIKRILPHLAANDDFVRMFIDEAKLVSLLNHQNICPVIELGRCEDGLYIVMEYIWGRDLRQVLNSLGKAGRLMPLTVAAHIAGRIAEGLDYAHRRSSIRGESLNIVHRDVSPQNVLLSFDGEVKVIDFGIARASRRTTETRAGTFKGKFAYMSPEQARGKPLDRRSDIFSVGILLHEMITGRRLFASKNDLDTLDRVRKCEVPVPSRPFEDVPEELAGIAMKALHPDLEQRYQWAGQLQEDLDRFLVMSGELATASRLGTWICLNFAEHAAQSLVDQERAARAQPPVQAQNQDQPQNRRTALPPPPNQFEQYIPLGENGANPGVGTSTYTASAPHEDSQSMRDVQPDIEFEIDDEIFALVNEDEFFQTKDHGAKEGSDPLVVDDFKQPQDQNVDPNKISRDSWPSVVDEFVEPYRQSDVPPSGGSWNEQPSRSGVVPKTRSSTPDIRDTVPPNPQHADDRPSRTTPIKHDPKRRYSTPSPPPLFDPKTEVGIDISPVIDGLEDEGEDIIFDDYPPQESKKRKP